MCFSWILQSSSVPQQYKNPVFSSLPDRMTPAHPPPAARPCSKAGLKTARSKVAKRQEDVEREPANPDFRAALEAAQAEFERQKQSNAARTAQLNAQGGITASQQRHRKFLEKKSEQEAAKQSEGQMDVLGNTMGELGGEDPIVIEDSDHPEGEIEAVGKRDAGKLVTGQMGRCLTSLWPVDNLIYLGGSYLWQQREPWGELDFGN